MKALLLFALALAAFIPLRADTNILANGDFSEGRAHWKGDGVDASATDIADISSSLADSGSTKGMMFKLKPMNWSMASQTFHSSETTLTFSMTYTTSADYALTGHFAGNMAQALGMMLRLPLTGGGGANPPPSSAMVVVADLSQNEILYAPISAKPAPNGAVTSTVTLTGLMEYEEKTLYLIFPGGTGTVTFSNISLNKPDDPAQN